MTRAMARWTIPLAIAAALLLAACAPRVAEAPTQGPGDATVTPSEPSTQTTSPPESDEPTEPPKPKKPKVDSAVPSSARSLYRTAIVKRAYRSWSKAPGFSKRQPGTGPHGARIMVYVNDAVSDTLDRSSASKWPVGSKIVKDGFDSSGSHEKVAYMHKTRRGWYFAEWDGGGDLIAAGLEEPLCANCHAQGSDSVRSFELP